MFWSLAIDRAEENNWPAGSAAELRESSRPYPVAENHIYEPSSYQRARGLSSGRGLLDA